MNLPPPYPLAWPPRRSRSPKPASSQFRTSLPVAIKNVRDSLRRFAEDTGRKIDAHVVTSNAALGDERPADSGVAVWFIWEGETRCIAVDRYAKVQDNLQAIYHVLEARRTEARHAGIELAREAFVGAVHALPAPEQSAHWTVELGIGATTDPDRIQTAWKKRVYEARQQGDEPLVARLNIARDQALKEAEAAG